MDGQRSYVFPEDSEQQLIELWERSKRPGARPCNFQASSRNVRLKNDTILVAECRSRSGEWRGSTIELNKFLANHDGRFAAGSGFRKSYQPPLELRDDGRLLRTRLLDLRGNAQEATANLERFIGNEDGALVCLYGEDLTCPVCKSFPRHTVQSLEARKLKSAKRLANCPSCHIFETLMKSVQHKGFSDQTTRIHANRGDKDTLPKLVFEDVLNNQKLEEVFVMYRHSTSVHHKKHPQINNRDFALQAIDLKSSIQLPVYTREHQFDSSKVGSWHHLTSGSHSREGIELVRGWIKECEDKHETCKQVQQRTVAGYRSGSLPSRLIDVGRDGDDCVRLRSTHGLSGRYACLSHCWGKSHTLMLTQSNMADFETGVSVAALQRVYRDAIAFCRKLGIQYIWIDALTIIQDSPHDWAVEAAKMASYYGNCHLCLAATSASNHDGACSTDTPKFKFEGKGLEGEDYCVFVRPSTTHIANDAHDEYFPLLKRAWVYQERRLAPRVLHFCKSEVFFECTSMGVCECRWTPEALKSLGWTKNRETRPAGHRIGAIKKAPNAEGELARNQWHTYVMEYSKLDFTYIADRLPALSGLAKSTRHWRNQLGIQSGRYLAGLWEAQLASDMAWSVGKSVARVQREGGIMTFWGDAEQKKKVLKPQHGRPQEYIAPSWSWASVLDVVQFAPFEYTTSLCRILEANVELVGSDDCGQVRSGSLVIQGRLIKSGHDFLRGEHRLTDLIGTRLTMLVLNDDGMAWYPDYNINSSGRGRLGSEEMLYVMPLVSRPVIGRDKDAEFRLRYYPGRTKIETVYLVLRRAVSDSVPVFERVGWTEYMGSSEGPDLRKAEEMKFMLV